jgi:hypothetical protein
VVMGDGAMWSLKKQRKGNGSMIQNAGDPGSNGRETEHLYNVCYNV